jgi:Family of unknown function (DUF5994)
VSYQPTLHSDAPRRVPPAEIGCRHLEGEAALANSVASADLPIELPDLLAVLSVRLGRIDQVMYNLNEWLTAPKRLKADRQPVRLAGDSGQPVSTTEYALRIATRSSC